MPGHAAEQANNPTVDKLESQKKSAESEAGLAEGIKAKIVELYDQAIAFTQQAVQLETQFMDLTKKVETAPMRLREIQQQLTQPASEQELVQRLPAGASQEQIEQLILQEEVNLNAIVETHKEKQAVLSRLADASKTLRDDLADRYKRLEKINADLESPTPPEEAAALTQARKYALQARKALRAVEVKQFKLQLENEGLLTSLTTAERDLAAASITRLQPQIVTLRATAQRLRETKASKVLEEAERARTRVVGQPQEIRTVADEYVTLSGELERLIRKEAQILERLRSAQLEHESIRSNYESTRSRVEVAGPTDAIGRMLRKRLDALPSVKAYRRTASKRRAEISQATDRQIDIDELRLEYSGAKRAAEQLVVSIPGEAVDNEEKKSRFDEALNLIMAKQRTLNELYKVYGRYISELTSLDTAEQQLVDVSKEFVAFINEQLLWIRSTPPLSAQDAIGITSAITWLISPLNWIKVATDILSVFKRNPLVVIVGLLFITALILLRGSAKHRLNDLAKLTVKIRTDSFVHTFMALFYTLMLVAGWPALLVFLGWQLGKLPTADTYTLAVSDGLMAAAVILFSTDFFRQLCRVNGLADRHFRWPLKVREQLRREFHWLVVTAAPLTYIIMATSETDQAVYAPTLGRPAFVLLMLGLTVLAYRVLRNSSVLTHYLKEKRPSHWLTQLRIFWVPITIFSPLALILVTFLGYHHSALHLSLRLLMTLLFFLGLSLLKDLLLRWLYIEQRRLKFDDALRKRDELHAYRMKEETVSELESSLPTVEEPEVNYDQLSEQAKRLLKTGLLLGAIIGVWSIWADVLPALGFLDRIYLPFAATELIDGVEKQVPVTLADIGIGLMIAFLTLFAAKNLPGVLEITLLQHLPLDAGGRYAFTTLSQYLIVGIGIIAAFNMIGAEWSSIQWLVAALGVGLGFGLQEIFANFVSGLIILFERPVRVGDTVTVADLSGKVARIRIRATTITDWDRKEIIVPNKDFITGRLINWTLTDPITRVKIPIGIAYGSDTNLAYKVIRETALSNPMVLAEPKLQLFFLGFGESSLNFELRVFVRQLDDRMPVTHDLHMAINEALKQHNIQIPFPQRDIHIRSTDESQNVISGSSVEGKANHQPDSASYRGAPIHGPVQSD